MLCWDQDQTDPFPQSDAPPPCHIPPMPARDICLSAYAHVAFQFFLSCSDQSKLPAGQYEAFTHRHLLQGSPPTGILLLVPVGPSAVGGVRVRGRQTSAAGIPAIFVPFVILS